MGDVIRALLAAVSTLAVLGACSAKGQATENLAVTYLDGHREGGVVTTVKVPVAESVKAGATWDVSIEGDGCETDGRTLVLHPRDGGETVRVGEPCTWDDSPGFMSPDGRYLAAYVLGDGSAAQLHVVGLGSSPADTGIVPGSRSSNYSATWTRDGRLWFTSDLTDRTTNKIFGYRPGEQHSIGVRIPKAGVVTTVAARP